MNTKEESFRFITGKSVVAIASLVTIICFFLPWLSSYAMGVVYMGTDSGIHFAITNSHASGLPGWPYSATLITAVICLIVSGMYIKRNYPTKLIPVTQIVLAVLGLLPFILLKVEVGYWNGVAVVTHFGLWPQF